jgi:hypothetical protein
MLVVLLLGLLLLREPRFNDWDELFLRWLLKHSQPNGEQVPLTVVEIGRDPLMDTRAPDEAAPGTQSASSGIGISPLEFALFLQAALEFKPEVIAFENILRWRERDKDQEQVFLDQAMRVPKLVVAAELTGSPDPDDPVAEVTGFTQVKGKRGNLPEFSGISRRPSEDTRLVSTVGFVNLPEEMVSDIRVPLLFLYRGEVIPSFPLQALLLWLGITPAEVKVEVGSHIALPSGQRIPIGSDGTMLIHPQAAQRARRLTLNELLLATQHREQANATAGEPLDLAKDIVLARTPANPLAPPDVFTATLASLQGGIQLRRVSKIFDGVVLLVAAGLIGFARRIDRSDLILIGIAITAAYCLTALAVISRWDLWLPGALPLGAVWLCILTALIFRTRDESGVATVTIPPPIP